LNKKIKSRHNKIGSVGKYSPIPPILRASRFKEKGVIATRKKNKLSRLKLIK
jgi:hypothetical protein